MYAIYKGNIYCMQYTKGIYIVYNVQSFRQNPTKSDNSMSNIVDDKKNRSLDKIQQYIRI